MPKLVLKIPVPDTFIPELLENLPEYAQYSFKCTGWDYNKCEFDLICTETDKQYKLTLAKAEKGFKLFSSMVYAGKLPGLSVSGMNLLDSGNWDAYDMDAFLQCCLLKEVIYG